MEPRIIHLLSNVLECFSSGKIISIFRLHLPDHILENNQVIQNTLKSRSFSSKNDPLRILNELKSIENSIKIIVDLIDALETETPTDYRCNKEEFKKRISKLYNSFNLQNTDSELKHIKDFEEFKLFFNSILEKVTNMEISLENIDIKTSLDLIIEKPDDLKRILIKIVKTEQIPLEQKTVWSSLIIKHLELKKIFDRPNWLRVIKRVAKIILGELKSELIANGFEALVNYLTNRKKRK